jgi:hypothetical protein
VVISKSLIQSAFLKVVDFNSSTTVEIMLKSKKFVTIQRNKSAFDSVGRSLMSGAEAMLLASAPLSQRFTFLAE